MFGIGSRFSAAEPMGLICEPGMVALGNAVRVAFPFTTSVEFGS